MRNVNYKQVGIVLLIILVILLIVGYFSMSAMKPPSSNYEPPIDYPQPDAIVMLEEVAAEEAPRPMAMPADRTYGSAYSKTNEDEASFGRVKGHRHAIVSTLEELKTYNDMVTYVLFPKNKSYALMDRTTRRYKKVLTLIQELKQTNANTSGNKSKRNNKFLLMRQKEKDGKVTIDNYNYTLAGDVLEFLENKANISFSENGPYFITTIDNPFDGTDKFSFLYVNLSHFNGSGVTEILESFKRRLQYTGNSEFGFLEKLKAKILAFSMSSNDDIESFTEVFTTPAYARD